MAETSAAVILAMTAAMAGTAADDFGRSRANTMTDRRNPAPLWTCAVAGEASGISQYRTNDIDVPDHGGYESGSSACLSERCLTDLSSL